MKNSIILLLSLISFYSCQPKKELSFEIKSDLHSFSNPADFKISHLDLDLIVDFKSKTLSGSASLDIQKTGNNDTLILDAKGLQVTKIIDNSNDELPFSIGEHHELLGEPLKILVKPSSKKVKIFYKTSPEAAALQWLEPSQTFDKKHPFLFTQSQAILARSWIPCMDIPGLKYTYEAKITVPKGMIALMSAENKREKSSDGVYYFKMGQPVSSYLMALTAGDLSFQELGKNCGVFAEPGMIRKAAYEFGDLDKMIRAAENLYGPYQWGRYDIVVLPPSFPFGGMENPRLTFATPTIITGDRSLVALIAHELAHSWSGNLVTNTSWEDFWLNEGFTMYFEGRIMEQLYGKDYAAMLEYLGFEELKKTLSGMEPKSRESWLKADLKGKDPDDGVSDIAYEKGRFFLRTIEEAVGRNKWDEFLLKYFEKHAFKSMDTERFLQYLDQELIKGNDTLIKKIRVNDWVYGPGIPDNCPEVKAPGFIPVENAVKEFMAGSSASNLKIENWNTHQWMHFLRSMPRKLSQTQMKDLDQTFGFSSSRNSEIINDWILLSISSNYQAAYPKMEEFLGSVGRRKFIAPIFEELSKTPAGLKKAKQIYSKTRSGYHSVTRETVDEILGV